MKQLRMKREQVEEAMEKLKNKTEVGRRMEKHE